MENWTVKKIKEACVKLGSKPPSGLLKKDLINYYYGYKKIIDQKIPLSIGFDVEDLNIIPVYCNLKNGQTWYQHFIENGWVAVPLVNFDSSYYVNLFYNWLESLSVNFKRNDRNSWISKNIPLNLHGIFKNYIGHCEFIWQIREKCYPIFKELWQTTDLLCSFDGGCFLKPPKGKYRQWIHNDQGRLASDNPISIQGLVNLLDNGPEDGGLLLMEGSHNIFGNYLERHPIDGIGGGFFRADKNDSELKKCRSIKICAPAGHLLLWDSRIFHSNVPPSIGNGPRMCTYVCMQPRSGVTDKILKKRIDAYEKGRMTNHWCYGPLFKVMSKDPRTYGNDHVHPKDVEIAELNDVRRNLIGY